jgi:hypothetical protein
MLPAYNPAQHLPPAVDLMPPLTVNAAGRVYLSRALAAKLNLSSGQPINLLPPSNGTPYWHLDLRPEAQRRLYWYADCRPRIEGIEVPDGLLAYGQLLTLKLLPGRPHFEGFYPLLPDTAAHAYATQR